MTNKSNPALNVAKKQQRASEEVILSTGIRAILVPVASNAIQEAVAEVTMPQVPTQEIEGRSEPVENPNHPDYIVALETAKQEQAQAALDICIVLGVELIDGLPEDVKWLKKLQWLAKRKRISLDGYDLDDEMDVEFLYKKHIAMSNVDWELLGSISGISQEDRQQAADMFQSNT